jgi:hypothetical protein
VPSRLLEIVQLRWHRLRRRQNGRHASRATRVARAAPAAHEQTKAQAEHPLTHTHGRTPCSRPRSRSRPLLSPPLADSRFPST